MIPTAWCIRVCARVDQPAPHGVAIITRFTLPRSTGAAPPSTHDPDDQRRQYERGDARRGGQVGVGNLSLSTVERPEVQIVDNSGYHRVDLQATGDHPRPVDLRFRHRRQRRRPRQYRIGNFTGTLIWQNVLGSAATGFTDPGGATRSIGDNIRSQGVDNGVVRNNLIGSAGQGLRGGVRFERVADREQ